MATTTRFIKIGTPLATCTLSLVLIGSIVADVTIFTSPLLYVLLAITTVVLVVSVVAYLYAQTCDEVSPIRPADLPEGQRQNEPWRGADNPVPYIKRAKAELARLDSELINIYIEDERLRRAERRPEMYWTFGHRVARRIFRAGFFGHADAAERRAEALKSQLTSFYNGNDGEIRHDIEDQIAVLDDKIKKAVSGQKNTSKLSDEIRKLRRDLAEVTAHIASQKEKAVPVATLPNDGDKEKFDEWVEENYHDQLASHMKELNKLKARMQAVALAKTMREEIEQQVVTGRLTAEEGQRFKGWVDEKYGPSDQQADSPFKR
jgi:DNA repair exonuclease SbcCD ATPase subunit